jgi:hypothetical protein
VLTEKRTEIKTALDDGEGKPEGFRSFEYIGETLEPPCAAIVPAEPYIRPPSATERVPFRHVQLGIDVLLISARDDQKKAAQATDELIEFAYRVLNPQFTVRSVSRPGVITISGAKFIGSVLSIEQLTEEP